MEDNFSADDTYHFRFFERRDFISTALKAAGASAMLAIPGSSMALSRHLSKSYTVGEIINIILREIPGAPFRQTVDTIKSGSADQRVSAIVTTMFPTINVIRETIKQKANFIIAHEPTYYNHTDDTNWVPGNSVQERKEALLKQYGICIWRFHDSWHSHRPDGITYGVLKSAGWLPYYRASTPVLELPSTPLGQLVAHLKSSLGIDHVRVIGDLQQPCKRVILMPGAAGGQRQIAMAEREKPDVLIVGEVHEWETAEYIRDDRLLGSGISLIVLGHSVSEEPGMQWLVEWLQPMVPGLKITHIPSGNPFTWV